MKLSFIVSLCCILGCLVDAHNLCGNWEPFKNEKCFKVLENLANYTMAEKACGAQGDATLLSINSPQEQTFFSQFLFTTSKVVDNVWIDVRGKGGQFNWQDLSSLVMYGYSNGSGPLNRDLIGACVQMNSEDGRSGTLAVVWCSKRNLVVCQRAPIISLETLKELVFKMKTENEQHRKQYQETLKEQAALAQLKNTQLEGKLQFALQQLCEQKSKITQLEATPSLPLGFIYVQLPKESAPSELWPSMTWTEVSSTYAGVFFRVAGGGASDFGSIQEENAPKLTQVQHNYCQSSPSSTCGRIKWDNPLSIPSDGTWSDYVPTAGVFVYTGDGIESCKVKKFIDYLRFHHSPGEVRPRNMAVKVWKRTG